MSFPFILRTTYFLTATHHRRAKRRNGVADGSMRLVENALHLGQSLLAGSRVVSAVGIARSRHEGLDRLYLLRRYVTKVDLCSCDEVRSWLTMHCGCSALSRGAPCSSLRFEPGINRSLNAVDILRTWARKTRRYRCRERHHADRQWPPNAHNQRTFTGAVALVHPRAVEENYSFGYPSLIQVKEPC